ncbi:tyrosine-type recombinase/integrase [Kocuria sp.]|uniref:tyrosine-type recombinase/integrase n=1 Tax=Kocuria sp. TaxID=1871328 RepID=UPI0026E10D84|nr:site-specific integrase [Kocuria sp.]MDO5618761.1 site-specific integrase [Kocuria sp.]
MASIKKRPNGSWRARYRDQDGKEHAKHFPRKIDAQKWLDTVTVDTATGRYVDPSNDSITLRTYYQDFRARQIWNHRTQQAVDQSINSAGFLDLPFGKLRRSHVQTWVQEQAQTLAASTIKVRFTNLRTVIRCAVADRLLREDVTLGVSLPKQRRREQHTVIPSPARVATLIDAADARHRPLFALCAFAGLRIGEACAVRVQDIDFLGRKLRVANQVARKAGGGLELCPPKAHSERDVYLPDDLLNMLSQHIGQGVHGVEGFLFATASGGLMGGSSADYRWNQARKQVGGEPCRIHDLRHFYASGLIAAGCDVVTVQRALGHASATITLNTYSHMWPSAEDTTRAAAAGLMRAAAEAPADPVRTATQPN